VKSYNIIKICWNPKASQLRINVTTRGLVTFQKNGKSLPRQRWSWVTLSEYDESFFGYERLSSQPKNKPIEYTDTLDDVELYIKQKKTLHVDAIQYMKFGLPLRKRILTNQLCGLSMMEIAAYDQRIL